MDLEICVDSVESAIAAARGGAQRVELCSALGEGGITPSHGLIHAVRAAVPIDVFVMIRPRGGDFLYTNHEFEVMRADIVAAKAAGIHGFALGLLTPEGHIDIERTRRLVEQARPLQVTFHRAFDYAADMDRALEDVIACGPDRLLTSGGEPDAVRGLHKIARLRQAAGDRLRIMAGGGVRERNVRKMVQGTGVFEVHTSLSRRLPATAPNGNPHLNLGAGPERYARFLVLEEDVRGIRSALDAIESANGGTAHHSRR
jgi:copper homeostasis protein